MRGFLVLAVSLVLGSQMSIAQEWEPSEAQKKAAIRTANAYFEMIDNGRYKMAYTMLAPSLRANVSEEQYALHWQDNRRRAGTLASRNFTKVTWYPKGTGEGTGVAVAIDYEGSFTRSNIYCGYLVLVEMPGGYFELLRDDITLATTETIRKMPPQVRIQIFNRPGCRRYLSEDE